MITKIQLQKDATVITATGERIGSLERVVVNPSNNVITDIVVRTGGLLKQEQKVVPVGLVDETTEDKILLHDNAGKLEAFPPFEEKRIVSEKGSLTSTEEDSPSMMTGYTALGTPMAQTPNRQIVTRIEQNIPEGTVAMKEGAQVITAEGKNVGGVERVLADPTVDQVTHLLVSRGFFAKEAKLIPIQWVMMIGEDKVHLRVGKGSIKALADVAG